MTEQANNILKKAVTLFPLLIRYVALAGVISSLFLILSELRQPGTCPLLFGLPACYLVFLSYFSVYLSTSRVHINSFDLLFWFGSVPGLMMGVWFSIQHIQQLGDCPIFYSIPLCYVSLAVFLFLIDLKILTRLFRSRLLNDGENPTLCC